MNHIERFYATVERKPVDRPACWLGFPTASSYEGLFRYFGVKSLDELKVRLEDDVYSLELPYHSPAGNSYANALNFAKNHKTGWENLTLTASGFFEGYSDPEAVDEFPWPDPSKYIDAEECRQAIAGIPKDYAILCPLWSAHFQDACAAFGMETALVKMLLEPDMFRAVIDRITEFYMKGNEIYYNAVGDKIHAVLLGNDLGSQTGLILSPAQLKEFVMPGIRKLVGQAKSYGLKVVYHSCGAIFDIIPELIEAGADIIHPIQALAKGMQPERLKTEYGGRVSFCGGVDTQDLLVNGSRQEVFDKVRELCDIFPTGLIVSPSHEAILPDIKPENIEAMFRAINKK